MGTLVTTWAVIWVATWAVTGVATWVVIWEATWAETWQTNTVEIWVEETSVAVAETTIIMVVGVVAGEASVPGTADGGEVTTGAENSQTVWVCLLPLQLVDLHLLQASDQGLGKGDLPQLVWETQDFKHDER